MFMEENKSITVFTMRWANMFFAICCKKKKKKKNIATFINYVQIFILKHVVLILYLLHYLLMFHSIKLIF